MSARKLEETDELKHNKVDKTLSNAIQQARMAKKMTQKDLATAINEKAQVIAEYESGKAIPNGQIIVKIERALGCKLPRPAKKPAAASSGGSSSGTSAGKKIGTGAKPGVTRGGPPKRR
jgi:putative transcription factor